MTGFCRPAPTNGTVTCTAGVSESAYSSAAWVDTSGRNAGIRWALRKAGTEVCCAALEGSSASSLLVLCRGHRVRYLSHHAESRRRHTRAA